MISERLSRFILTSERVVKRPVGRGRSRCRAAYCSLLFFGRSKEARHDCGFHGKYRDEGGLHDVFGRCKNAGAWFRMQKSHVEG
jgi:hypothetical protein